MTTHVPDLLAERLFLTSAGTETYLVFQQGFDLPEFCGFVVFDDEGAWAQLEQNYLWPILDTAARHGCALMVDSLLWRAQPDFVRRLGRPVEQVGLINRTAVARTRDSVARWRRKSLHDTSSVPVLVVADIGPRGDAYKVDSIRESAAEARAYHGPQIEAAAEAGADLVCALTMTTPAESIGIVEAARSYGMPVIVSATVETDGRLPDGTPLGTFIEAVDDATDSASLFYMVNCAHPSHLTPTLTRAQQDRERWLARFRGFRANASRKTHEELDNSTVLDRGDVAELARAVAEMHRAFGLRVVGGCCGTDHEHLAAMAQSVTAPPA